MAYSIGLTAGVVYDEDTDIYQMTSGLANELGKVVFDIDPVTSYSFNYSTQINANQTGDYAGSNGYFEVRLGDTVDGVTFFVDHSENGADLYVHHNSYLIGNLEITNFKFNVPQTMEINCVENTFIMSYDDVFLGDIYCDSNILFSDGWLEFTACNVLGTTAILDSYNYEPNFTVTHAARFMNGIQCDDWDGIMLEHIGDCWWSNVDPENSSNMHTMGNIGIGTTDPLYNLHVDGTIFASSYCNIQWVDIENKPVIEAQINADWNATTGVAQILNKPIIPSAQVNSDWNATTGVEQILNKPTLLQGEKGDKGDPGQNGSDGTPGIPGIPGVPGPPGAPGAAGLPGSSGSSGSDGSDGAKGDKGDKGDTGAAGSAINPDWNVTDSALPAFIQNKPEFLSRWWEDPNSADSIYYQPTVGRVGIGKSPASGFKLDVDGQVRGTIFTSTTEDVSPFQVSSLVRVDNLNASLLDGLGKGAFMRTDIPTSTTQNFTTSAIITCKQVVSSTTTFPPFLVESTIKVINLNADLLDGLDSTAFMRADGATSTTGTLTGSRLISTIATGTAPLTVTSTTLVPNLNVALFNGQDAAYYLSYANLTGVPATSSSQWTTSGTDIYYNTGNIGVGIAVPAAKLHVVGAILATADVTAYYSDRRLKKDVREITSALDKLSKIRGVYYTQNELAETFGYHNYEPQVGVIAQELQAVLPEAVKLAPFDTNAEQVSISGENYLTVQYHKIVPLLIQAIKEQQEEINDLRRIVLKK